MLCNECKKQLTCKALCKEAEEYVDQDALSMRAIRFTEIGLIEETIQRGVDDVHSGFVRNGRGPRYREKGITLCPLVAKKVYHRGRCLECKQEAICWPTEIRRYINFEFTQRRNNR